MISKIDLPFNGTIFVNFLWGHSMAKKKIKKGIWTKNDLALLRKLFPGSPTADVAARLGRPTEAVKKKASRMELRKSKKYMKSLGRT